MRTIYKAPTNALKCALALAFMSLTIVAPAKATDLSDYVDITMTYVADADGWNYGIRYHVNSTYNGYVCVYTRVTERTNVNGSSQPGPVLMNPNEKAFLIGSFNAAVSGEAWSVNIQYTGDDNCY
jgi:hypothetical protein